MNFCPEREAATPPKHAALAQRIQDARDVRMARRSILQRSSAIAPPVRTVSKPKKKRAPVPVELR